MTYRWTWVLTWLTLFTLAATAQEPIPLPIPEPALTTIDDDALSIRESAIPTMSQEVQGENPGAAPNDADFRSILVDPASEANDRIPLAPAPEVKSVKPEIETAKPITETKPATSQAIDDLLRGTSEPASGDSFSSSLKGIDSPGPQTPSEDPSKQRNGIRAPAARTNNQPSRVRAPIEAPVRRGQSTDSDSQPREAPFSRRVVVPRVRSAVPVQPGRPIAGESDSSIASVAPATFDSPFRRLNPAVYRRAGALAVAPVGASEGVLVPRRFRPNGYGSPAPVDIGPLGYGGPRGPAGQPPQPRPFVPYQPVRNFFRGIGPY